MKLQKYLILIFYIFILLSKAELCSMDRIVIRGSGSISSAGYNPKKDHVGLPTPKSFITREPFSMGTYPVARLDSIGEKAISDLIGTNTSYKHLDRSALMAIIASRVAFANAGWKDEEEICVNIGSSRGATATYEGLHEQFINTGGRQTSVYTSPSTTLGNISSWVMQDLNIDGPLINNSMTCSTGLQAIANGVAWLRAGMVQRFLAGASEAPLTDFTLAQMQALKIYSAAADEYPCRPFGADAKTNQMVLGEGAAVFALEKWNSDIDENNVHGEILSIGFGSEILSSPASISAGGTCLIKSMQMAIKNMPSERRIDLILCHAPGTINGDKAEMNAINEVFGGDIPALFSNKWQIGHTLGASGVLSMELALAILKTGKCPRLPYPSLINNPSAPIKTVMINAAGFGGNAVSVVIGSLGD
jgi:3-oxoacyl-[acyl-carrier-protein] synthase II